MDFWDLTKLIFRRWAISLPLLLLTMVAGGWVFLAVEPDYKATSYIQLIPPAVRPGDSPADKVINPWLDLGLDNLNKAASLITTDSNFLEQLDKSGLSDAVTITDGYPNPAATIEVIGSDKQEALATTDLVLQRYLDAVKRLQTDRGVRPENMIITVRLDTGSNLEETGGKVKRAFIAVVAVGILLTAGLTIGYDAMARRRQRRRLNLDDLGPGMPTPMPRPTYPQQDTGGIRRQPVGLGGTGGGMGGGSGMGGGGDIGAGRSLTASQLVDPVPTPTDHTGARDLEFLAQPSGDEPARSPALINDVKPAPGEPTVILPLSIGSRRTDDKGGARR